MQKFMITVVCSICFLSLWTASSIAFQEQDSERSVVTRWVVPPQSPESPARVQTNAPRVFGLADRASQRKPDPMSLAIDSLKNAENEESEDEAKGVIREELEKQYAQFLAANEQQIEDLQTRLDNLRDQLERRRRAKTKMVDLEMERVINETEGLIWPEDQSRFPNRMNPFGQSFKRTKNGYIFETQTNSDGRWFSSQRKEASPFTEKRNRQQDSNR